MSKHKAKESKSHSVIEEDMGLAESIGRSTVSESVSDPGEFVVSASVSRGTFGVKEYVCVTNKGRIFQKEADDPWIEMELPRFDKRRATNES